MGIAFALSTLWSDMNLAVCACVCTIVRYKPIGCAYCKLKTVTLIIRMIDSLNSNTSLSLLGAHEREEYVCSLLQFLWFKWWHLLTIDTFFCIWIERKRRRRRRRTRQRHKHIKSFTITMCHALMLRFQFHYSSFPNQTWNGPLFHLKCLVFVHSFILSLRLRSHGFTFRDNLFSYLFIHTVYHWFISYLTLWPNRAPPHTQLSQHMQMFACTLRVRNGIRIDVIVWQSVYYVHAR